jgi:enamine deaminase RidA (YjgF/YER057c/UK114 family)
MVETTFIVLHPEAGRATVRSDIVTVGEWAFISGLLPTDLENDRAPLPEYIEEQTQKVFANLELLLAKIGATKDDVVSVRVALTRFDKLYERMERVYADYFAAGRRPTRSLSGVTHLTRGAQVEMDFVIRRRS